MSGAVLEKERELLDFKDGRCFFFRTKPSDFIEIFVTGLYPHIGSRIPSYTLNSQVFVDFFALEVSHKIRTS